MDLNELKSDLKKALDLSGTTGILEQPEIDKVIQDFLDHTSPLRANMPRRPASAGAWRLNQKKTQPALGGFVNDTEEPTDETLSRTRKEFAIKTILRRGKVTRRAQADGATYKDLLAQEIQDITLLVRDDEENGLTNGDATANVKQFDGLRVLTPAGQTISAAGPLTIDLMDQAMDRLLGRPKLIVMSKKNRRKLYALLQSQQRWNDVVEVNGGFRVTTYAGTPILYSPRISDTQGAGNNETDLFVIDHDFVWVGVETEVRMLPLAKKSSQFDEFDVFMDETLVLANETFGISSVDQIIN